MNRAKNIEISSGTNVALIRREAENGDGKFLINPGFSAQRGPTNCPFSNRIDAILKGVSLTSGVIPTRQHDGFDRTIQLRNGNLKSHLHRMQAEVAALPFLGGLEHQRQRHHVGAIELLQRLNRLGVILTSGSPDKRESR